MIDNDVDVENGEAVSFKKKPAPTFMEGFFKEVITELGVNCSLIIMQRQEIMSTNLSAKARMLLAVDALPSISG